MVDPKKRIRQTLFSIFPLSYRIKTLGVSKELMDRKLFIEIITLLKKIDDRRDFMLQEIGMDVTTYEDDFFHVIENLMKLHFSKEQLALIQTYLYSLTPDKDWDGTIVLHTGKEERKVPFKEPSDVWRVINSFKK